MSASTEFDTFGSWLKHRRRQLDLTQEQLGRLAGCSGAAIRKIEAGERKPSPQLAELLAVALQVPQDERQVFIQLARGTWSQTTPFTTSPEFAVRFLGNLPAPLTSLVDRHNDLAALSALLNDPGIRWITVVGPPGIGKTRLSIQGGMQVLPDFPDGVWFVDLAPLDHPDYVLSAVSRALAVFNLSPAPGFDQLASYLKDRSALLILDNFEHLTAAAVEVAALLKRCPRLKLLATSRIPLHVYGEYILRLPPLSVPSPDIASHPQALLGYESVQLFIARACQSYPPFALNAETAPAIARIVNTLGGIPLALELAAASLQRMTLIELDRLLNRLEGESWLSQVGVPFLDLPARQHTLENVVAWSYTLLAKPDQELFRSLSVFSDWFDVDAVAAICFSQGQSTSINPGEVRSLLDNLADHSLLVFDLSREFPSWRMLEIIHEYAAVQLDRAQRTVLEERRADYFLNRLQYIARQPEGRIRDDFFRLHLNNLQSTLKWAITVGRVLLGFQIVEYLDDFWSEHGFFKEVLDYLKPLFALPDPSPPEVRLSRLEKAADLAWQQHDFDSGLAFIKEAIELRRTHGLPDQAANDFNRLGRIHLEGGDYIQARQALEECLSLARSNPHSLNPGAPLAQLGELALIEGRLDESKIFFAEALDYLDESETIFLAISTVDMAEIFLAEQNFPLALDWLRRAVAYTSVHIRRALVYLCASAGYLLLASSSHTAASTAVSLFGAIDALGERSGVVFSPFYRDLIKSRLQLARQRLAGPEWEAAYQAGQRWSVETAQAKVCQALGFSSDC